MEYFHPDRPRLGNNRPMYLSPTGKPLAAMPLPTIQMLESGEVELSVMLSPHGGNSYRWYYWTGALQEIPFVLDEFYNNPEQCLRVRFNWQFEQHSSELSKSELAALIEEI